MDEQQYPVPRFRNPDKYQIHQWREWMRKNMPPGKKGFVAEDLDLVVLRFGALIGRQYSDDGQFVLIEIKERGVKLKHAQKRTFGLIDRLMRQADPKRKYYLGFYVVNWNNGVDVTINYKHRLTMEQFKEFLLGSIDPPIPSYFDKEVN